MLGDGYFSLILWRWRIDGDKLLVFAGGGLLQGYPHFAEQLSQLLHAHGRRLRRQGQHHGELGGDHLGGDWRSKSLPPGSACDLI